MDHCENKPVPHVAMSGGFSFSHNNLHKNTPKYQYQHTCNTVEKGTVLPRYGNHIPVPVPVPMHTHDHIVMVLPVPVSLLSDNHAKKWLFNLKNLAAGLA